MDAETTFHDDRIFTLTDAPEFVCRLVRGKDGTYTRARNGEYLLEPAMLTNGDVRAISRGGCASGAFMPAVTYWEAKVIMDTCGDDVMEYLEDMGGIDLAGLRMPHGTAWKSVASHFLAMAVDIWACDAGRALEEAMEDHEDV